MQIGLIGSGSWGTALAKIITDNQVPINWWIKKEEDLKILKEQGINQRYLSTARLNASLLNLSTDLREIIRQSDVLIIAIPSAYIEEVLAPFTAEDWKGKKVVSAVKGILPSKNNLLNEYFQEKFGLVLDNYFAILGPCHAEEVANEKLSYLTVSGKDVSVANKIASVLNNSYVNTIVNEDIHGVQYAAVLKNIYALGAGIATGLGYGDNFMSVLIANTADEMALFLKKFGAVHIDVGDDEEDDSHKRIPNYAASVYLGDLLVTAYSEHSRNRRFGKLLGEGHSIQTIQEIMRMVAEGLNAAKCIHVINQSVKAKIPIAETIYKILWEKVPPAEGFKHIESVLV